MSVQLLKLTSGEEMVAEVGDEDKDHIWVKNPLRLVVMEKGAALAPFFPAAKDGGLNGKKIKMERKFVMLSLDVDSDVSNAYNSQLGSGIVVPNAQQTMKLIDPE
ncbi:MAG: hypothetical protein DWQ19_09870 [Crenarchaeota archaeon]|nr:MAG: hypothetical protein DWQ19_09870 [Thermoproteota archaeon]